MKQLKNKKTGRIVDTLTEEQYAKFLKDAASCPEGFLKKFEVIDLKLKNIIPKEFTKTITTKK